jgi:hypothetical protein
VNDEIRHDGTPDAATSNSGELRGPALTRRQLLTVAAGAVVAAPLLESTALAAAAAVAGTKFLTPPELALLDELTELIIPTDEHSPGARAAKVAAYIDARLAEAFEPEIRTRWRDGLKAVDTLASSMHGQAFMACTPDQRVATLTRFAQNEKKPDSADDKFFVELKGWTVNVYYTSEIGIHQEMEYKGNTLQQEYSGVDVSQK